MLPQRQVFFALVFPNQEIKEKLSSPVFSTSLSTFASVACLKKAVLADCKYMKEIASLDQSDLSVYTCIESMIARTPLNNADLIEYGEGAEKPLIVKVPSVEIGNINYKFGSTFEKKGVSDC